MHNAIYWAIDCLCASSRAWLWISEVVAVAWMPGAAIVVVSQGFIVEVTTIVGSDMAVAVVGSGYKMGGWGDTGLTWQGVPLFLSS
jgi:hypothetical protein